MNSKAVRKDTISERLSTLAGAIGALEYAIAATDQALLATSSEELSAAISAQSQAAKRTMALKQSLQHSLPNAGKGSSRMSTLHDQLQAHPDATTLLPQYQQIEERLKAGQISLAQQAQVVNKMQAINRRLLGVLTDVDNHGYNQRGNHNDSDDGRLIARA